MLGQFLTKKLNLLGRGKIGLKFTFQLPRALSEGVPSSPNVRIETIKTRIGTGIRKENRFSTPEGWAGFFQESLNLSGSLSDNMQKQVKESVKEISGKAVELLKEAFSANLIAGASKWERVSDARLYRRAAFIASGKRLESALPVKDTVHYKNTLFESVIKNFKADIKYSDGKFKLVMKSPIPSSRHFDFAGYNSSYRGPNEIMLSIMGLNVKNPKGTATSGKKMIIPVGTSVNNIDISAPSVTGYYRQRHRKSGTSYWTWVNYGYTKRFDAVIGAGGKFKYPSKENPNPSGVPVIFRKSISVSPYFFQRPGSSKVRPVFWTQDSEGMIRFPRNVASAIERSGIIGKSKLKNVI